MKDIRKHITVEDKTYPLVFNLNVLEEIQEKYGSIEAWGNIVDGSEDKMPSIKGLKYGVQAMINEGIDIENEENGEDRKPLTSKQVGRLLTAYGVENVISDTQELTIESTKSDDEPKNA